MDTIGNPFPHMAVHLVSDLVKFFAKNVYELRQHLQWRRTWGHCWEAQPQL